MRSCERILVGALLIGPVVSWTPNSHFSAKQPTRTRSHPASNELNPVQWAATGIMAASLAFSPLPSNAANVAMMSEQVAVSLSNSLASGSFDESSIEASTRIPGIMLNDVDVEKASDVLATSSTLLASNPEQQTVVAEKAESPTLVVEESKAIESLASTTTTLVANNDAPKSTEAKKAEPKKDDKKAPAAKTKGAAKKTTSKKESNGNGALAIGIGTGAAITAAGVGASNRRSNVGYVDPRDTLRSNAPYSSQVYESGSYGGAVPFGSTQPRQRRMYRNREVTAGSRVPYPNYTKRRTRMRSSPNYYLDRNTNSADSNAPYSHDTYASGSYSSGFSIHNKSGRRWSNNRNYSVGPRRMIYNNPNAPYGEDTYANGSYGSNRYSSNNSVFRPKSDRRNKARQWNEAVRRRNRASYNFERRYGPDARKNGSVSNYIRPDGYNVNSDGYNPKEPW